MFEFITGWLNYAVYRLNNSLFFAGIIMLMLNIGARYIELKLDPSTENFLKTALTKEVLVFSVAWMGTRDLILALVLTAVFVVLADYGLNANSRYCIMPQKYRAMAESVAMSTGPIHASGGGGPPSGGGGPPSGGGGPPSGGAAIGGASKAGHGPGNIVTDKEISDAMDVLERAKKQRDAMKHNKYLTAFRSAKF
jgi:uncharacterized membrane protein YgcG